MLSLLSNPRSSMVGFSQRIQLDWMERTACLYAAGYSKDAIQDALREELRGAVSVGGEADRSNREKIITILMKTWVLVPRELEGIRDDGLAVLKSTPVEQHLPLHWGMAMAVYPFFGAVAETAGRLLNLQGTCAAAQVQRRIREQFGERETVGRAARRILRSFIDWSVLEETGQKGVYRAAPVRKVDDRRVATSLIEAVLVASGSNTAPLSAIRASLALFPFELCALGPDDLKSSIRIEVTRLALDEDMVGLRPR